MNILYHTWEPGLSGNHATSGGGGLWTNHLFGAFRAAGHNVTWFRSDALPIRADWEPEHPVDAAIFCWRWKFPDTEKFRERNTAFYRQNMLIQWCSKHNVPFIVHDQDLKMSYEARRFVADHGGRIATPSLFPAVDELSLHYPNPYRFEPLSRYRARELVYVGNNYERTDQFFKFLVPFSTVERTVVYGNWMEPSSDRMDPVTLKSLAPNIEFPGRLPQTEVLARLTEARATILLHKSEYGPRGFVTIRWAEAAAAGVLPFIPMEFQLPKPYDLLLSELRVIDGINLAEAFRGIDEPMYLQLLTNFRRFVSEYMTTSGWIAAVERMVNHAHV